MLKIKDIYVFQGLTKDFIDMVIDNSRRIEIKSWEYILKQWEKSNDEAYFIQDWEVDVEINWKVVNKIEEWNIFWEIALITNEPRTASVRANTDLILLKINKELLFNIIKNFINWKEIQKVIVERIKDNLWNK